VLTAQPRVEAGRVDLAEKVDDPPEVVELAAAAGAGVHMRPDGPPLVAVELVHCEQPERFAQLVVRCRVRGGAGHRWLVLLGRQVLVRARSADRARSAWTSMRSSLLTISITRQSVPMTKVRRRVRSGPNQRRTPKRDAISPVGSDSSGKSRFVDLHRTLQTSTGKPPPGVRRRRRAGLAWSIRRRSR
jgi:hypothetical protein